MSKIFLFLPLFLWAMTPTYWWVNDTIYLKKDYLVIYKIPYNGKKYTLKFRWTLYKNKGIVMLYNYKSIPFQNILYIKSQLNGFKKFIAINDSPNSPYFMIYFRNFDKDIAKFQFLIYNPEQNIRVKINEPRYKNKKWVQNLVPLYQKQFQKEVK